jgi:hypothetical protein
MALRRPPKVSPFRGWPNGLRLRFQLCRALELRGILKAIVPLTSRHRCSHSSLRCETVQGRWQGCLSSQALACVDSCTFCQGLRRLLFWKFVGRKESRDVSRWVIVFCSKLDKRILAMFRQFSALLLRRLLRRRKETDHGNGESYVQ